MPLHPDPCIPREFLKEVTYTRYVVCLWLRHHRAALSKVRIQCSKIQLFPKMKPSANRTTDSITPHWLTYQQAKIYSGLGTRVLENHVRAGYIRSSNVCAPGATRGRRLLSRFSLDSFIEAGIGGKTELAMNANRGGQS